MSRRGFAGVVVILVTVAMPRASAQLPDPQLTPSEPEARESDGEVVVTISNSTPGRVVYRTEDGCDTASGQRCYPTATASEDYGVVSGEIVFAEPGSRDIAIPIIDDDLDEGYSEGFSFHAYEGDDAAGWPTGRVVTVRIIDDDLDGGRAPSTTTTTTTTTAGGPSTSPPVPTLPTLADLPAPLATTPSTTALEVALASGELRPGPGFELTSGLPARPAPAGDEGGGGAASWLAVGVGGTAASAAAVTLARRRTRWSPTRA